MQDAGLRMERVACILHLVNAHAPQPFGLATGLLCSLFLQLADNVALFKPAADRQPLMLLPGRPPVSLPLDQPLMATAAAQQGNKVTGQHVCLVTSARSCTYLIIPALQARHNWSALFSFLALADQADRGLPGD
jgi:hypothetical protein